MGTINVLEALRSLASTSTLQLQRSSVTAIIVTTDKCYENHESGRAYEEQDPLGGHDPYSSSKAMAEIAVSAYRDSYFRNSTIRVASARAGNVIGGDWAEDRIVPDAMRALDRGEPIAVRNPKAVRPWQHVLEPLSGYLVLAARIAESAVEVESLSSGPACGTSTSTVQLQLASLCDAFNFGPGPDSNRTVSDLVDEVLKTRQGGWIDASQPGALHEATLLNLSIEKAERLLGGNRNGGLRKRSSGQLPGMIRFTVMRSPRWKSPVPRLPNIREIYHEEHGGDHPAQRLSNAEGFTMKSMESMKWVGSDLASKVIGCAIEVHRNLGPGLLESTYESCLCRELILNEISFERQVPLEVVYKGEHINCAYRMDIVVNGTLLLELKSTESIVPIHQAQIISYLKLAGLKQGLLINFNVRVLKDGIRSFFN